MHSPATASVFVFVGTYNEPGAAGVFVFRFDPGTGRLEPAGAYADARGPSYLALHPDGRHLYAVGEGDTIQGQRGGAVHAFALDPRSGALTFLNRQPSGGLGPCHVCLDASGRWALAANYVSGSVALLPIGTDGRLGPAADVVQHEGAGPDLERQKGPHAHFAAVSPDNRFAFVCDLGLDRVMVYRLDGEHGRLIPHAPRSAALPPGAGPRHLEFAQDGRHAYVVNELDSTVTAFAYDAAGGVLRDIQTLSTLPAGFAQPNSGADIHMHPAGRFLYASNRGHDSIAVFAVEPSTGRLTPAGHCSTLGRTPRNFSIDPAGRFLLAANQDSHTIVVFRIDAGNGLLTPTGHTAAVPMPVCVKFPRGIGHGGG